MSANEGRPSTLPDGIFSLLDTTGCILKYFPDVDVTYSFKNRTPEMKLNRAAVGWLETQFRKLANISLAEEEEEYLRETCKYFNEPYLKYLSTFRFRPNEHIALAFVPDDDTGSDEDEGSISLTIAGKWLETILYEIPLLALVSEAYFKFIDRDWTYEGQVERARHKGESLCQSGCFFSEFGSRRRRDYHTHELVIRGLQQAHDEAVGRDDWPGRLTGTSNVHFAMKHQLPPVGTVAHEFFMGLAALTDDYENANETALRYWVGTFGEGVLGIALTDTFGTADFCKAFQKKVLRFTTAETGSAATSAAAPPSSVGNLCTTKQPLRAPPDAGSAPEYSYAKVFTGVRQDSGDPEAFIKTMREFYDAVGIKEKKTIVFSDALNVEKCKRYKESAEAAGFQPTFGIGTFLTNDFVRKSTGKKSVPLNIVIKLSSAAGRPAIKLSDNMGKNTGDPATVEDVKRRLGYTEKSWSEGDESKRWGREGDQGEDV